MKKFIHIVLALAILLIVVNCKQNQNRKANKDKSFQVDYSKVYSSAKPYTRWWWFASIIKKEDIKHELEWIYENGFGGVEIAWIYPINRNPKQERIEWLGNEWQEVVTYTKYYCDSIGLGCDFTFGTLWPFGGTFVKDEDATKVFGDPDFWQPLRLSWTHPDTGNVVDHLDKNAFIRYAEVMGNALKPALKGSTSALFCDSWEVETKKIWTTKFDSIFQSRFGYDIKPCIDSIYEKGYEGQRYDYMKLVADLVLTEFYIPFTEKCHELKAFSRVQCAGSPTDLITAYANVDVPETEAMLYEPNYSRIVASAAVLADKLIVSSETFSCLYGFPGKYLGEEKTLDLKLVADALFANGVNQIIWHGKPFNPIGSDSIKFYATVHVGPSGTLSDELRPFNKYMSKVSTAMRNGRTYSETAIYLPLEDAWIAGEYPDSLQMKWSWGEYELRYEYIPDELKGYNPIWINNHFLKKGIVEDGQLKFNKIKFKLLYVDAKYLDIETLETIFELAKKGLPICLKKTPKQAGYYKNKKYQILLSELKSMKNVSQKLPEVCSYKPIIEGDNLPDFWARSTDTAYYLFFANPLSKNLKLPLKYGLSENNKTIYAPVKINLGENTYKHTLIFEPNESLLLKINERGVTSSLFNYKDYRLY